MDKRNIYEIYTKHPETGEGGWDILFVRCHADEIESYPLFDCVITVNDLPFGLSVTDFGRGAE